MHIWIDCQKFLVCSDCFQVVPVFDNGFLNECPRCKFIKYVKVDVKYVDVVVKDVNV